MRGRIAIEAGDALGGRQIRALHVVLIVVLTGVTYWPTLQNGFLPLGFDDGLILDTLAIRALSWGNLYTLLTEFNQAHYVPLTLLSLAVDFRLWELDPFGYHVTNVALQALTAVLAYGFAVPLLGSARLALCAALIFAVHPVQMEAVSLAVQRKTLLSGALFFLTLILYQAWCRSASRWTYVGALAAYVAAALAKPAVVTLPLFLLLYDYMVRPERMRLVDKVPFFAVAGAAALAAMGAHAAVGALHPPHGGTWVAHALMMSRVLLEYVDALLVPIHLAPAYYYPRAMVDAPFNVIALGAVVGCAVAVTYKRRDYPWSFFCFWWFVLSVLPESNIVPLAQLRADRFLYLAVMPFAVWLVIGCARLDRLISRVPSAGTRLLAPALIGLLAMVCYGSAAVWRNDVSAWRRVVDRHPWCAVAHGMLGRAFYEQGDLPRAEVMLVEAVRLSGRVPDPHLYLARVYAERGRRDLAQAAVHRYLELEPNDVEGLQLLAALSPTAVTQTEMR